MTTTKTLFAAALLSTFAAVSFAQAPAAPKAAEAAKGPAVATAPADAASKPTHHKKHHKHHAANVNAGQEPRLFAGEAADLILSC